MSNGRVGLEQVINQYERQRAEAMRIKQEAEIVLPFLRAAIEELESSSGEEPDAAAAPARRVSRRRESEVEEEPQAERRSSASVFGVSDEEAEAAADEDVAEDEEPRAERKGFGRPSIASLIDEAGKGKEKAG